MITLWSQQKEDNMVAILHYNTENLNQQIISSEKEMCFIIILFYSFNYHYRLGNWKIKKRFVSSLGKVLYFQENLINFQYGNVLIFSEGEQIKGRPKSEENIFLHESILG